MQTVILGCLMFTFVVLALVAIILAARSKLVSSGEVVININDNPDYSLKTAAGSTLLNTLSANKLFIPSACGGKVQSNAKYIRKMSLTRKTT